MTIFKKNGFTPTPERAMVESGGKAASARLVSGFTLIETLVGLGVFAIVATSIFLSYSNVLDIVNTARFNTASLAIMEGQAEIIRNMKYEDIGIINGSPPGKIQGTKVVNMDGLSVTLTTYIRNIDDPFDGTIGGAPNDLSPADYKLVEMEIGCSGCGKYSIPHFTTTVGPKNLESASNNGSLFITVLDANGQPIPNAAVSVTNTSVNPQIFINDFTALNGELQLVDIATSSVGYQITVSKSGYSTDLTYTPGLPANPNPLKPHATVAKQQLTRITFAIDRVSTVTLQTRDQFCAPVPSVDFTQNGLKLIGTNPDVLKFSQFLTTDGNGDKNDSSVEWDTYTFSNTDADQQIAGTSLFSPLTVNPNTTQSITWLMEPKSINALMVSVRTAAGQPIADASVQLTKVGFSETKLTSRRNLGQTDWSANNYNSKSANVDTDTQPGTLTLSQLGGKYATQSQEWLISKIFDMGANSTSFYNLTWNPTSQPGQAGPDSLKFQFAANNDNTTWNFSGPDGNPATYYTTSNTPLWSGLNNNRYLRYKVYLQTTDQTVTPSLTDLNVEFASACVPTDQTSFGGLGSGTYTLTISKPGYQTLVDPNVQINGQWQEYKAILNP